MDIPIADVMIHIDETLSREALAKIEDDLRQDECVISACVSAEDQHLMLVAYNPRCTSAQSLLTKVGRRGIHAELVGL
jgi:hypothetical protein